MDDVVGDEGAAHRGTSASAVSAGSSKVRDEYWKKIRNELPVGELVERIDLTYAGGSRHLALLRDAGFVTVRRDGKQRFYRADHDGLGPLKQFLESFWADQLDRLATLAEEAERR